MTASTRIRWVAAVVVAGLGIAWVLVSFLVTPVEVGGFVAVADGTDGVVSDRGVELMYDGGAEGGIRFTLRNPSPFSITITDLRVFPPFADGSGSGGMILQTEALVDGREPTESDASALAALGAVSELRPVMGSGGEVLFEVYGEFTNCDLYAPGSSFGMDTIEVSYRLLGLSHTRNIPGVSVEVARPDGSCG